MSQFLVSARKYRPSTFKEVVGQSHVTRTLKNALKNNQLAHSLLFCGPHGVGKTTIARILAKVLNCKNRTDDFEPCNECESCRAFQEQGSFNIIELDAASQSGVENVRSLIDKVRYPPERGSFKVFIIDEVHMFSKSAFNAFLKTLEEPPEYVVFILATTEKHKILPTILSRCQVYDFKRIQVKEIVDHLRSIAEDQNVKAEEDALYVIAQKSDGALRDALSLFDRLASFEPGKLTYENVIRNLNLLDYETFFTVTEGLITEDHLKPLQKLNKALEDGFELEHFLTGLAEHFRDLMVVKEGASIQLMQANPGLRDRYEQQAKQCSLSFLINGLHHLTDTEIHLREAQNKRLRVELALSKIAFMGRTVKNEKKSPAKKTEPTKEKGDPPAKPPLEKRSRIKPSEPKKNSDIPSVNLDSLKTENVNEQSSSSVEEVDLKIIRECWDKHLNKTRSRSLRSSLQKAILDYKEDHLEITVNSSHTKILFREEKKFVDELRSLLPRNGRAIRFKVKKNKEKAKKPARRTKKDIYRDMVKQNSHVEKLQKKLNLYLS